MGYTHSGHSQDDPLECDRKIVEFYSELSSILFFAIAYVLCLFYSVCIISQYKGFFKCTFTTFGNIFTHRSKTLAISVYPWSVQAETGKAILFTGLGKTGVSNFSLL